MTTKICIGGLGMATCAGLGAADSAASVRAGLSRFQPIEGLATFDEDELEGPVTGAPIPLLTKGFVQQARLLRLVEFALKDLLAQTELNSILGNPQEKLLVVWVLPELAETFFWPSDQVEQILQNFLVSPLCRRFGMPLATPGNGFFMEYASGGARAMRGLARSLESGHFSRALCISVDSLLEPLRLGQLIDEDRLKTSENPIGVIPGEAAAITLVETEDACLQRRGKPRARIYSANHRRLELDREAVNWRTTSAYDIGRQLGRLIIDTLGSLGEEHVFYGDIYLDLNGEEWRAVAWSAALLVLQGHKGIDMNYCRELFPAGTWGDIGATSGVANICLAATSFSRHYATSHLALVCTLSDLGDIGVVLVGK